MSEIWKAVPGLGGHYEASNMGRVRVKDRIVRKFSHFAGRVVEQHYAGRLLTPCKRGELDHLVVHLGFDGIKKNVFVHTMVLLAFVGPAPAGTECCHNNGEASDNRPENLRWDTHLENNRDRKRHGRYATGEAHHAHKFSAALITSIRAGAVSLSRAMSVYGMSRTHFYRVKHGS